MTDLAPDLAPAPAFALAGVRRRRGGRDVLAGVDLDLPALAVTALVGPSGAGKTSLLRLLNRLDEPDAGTVRYRGDALASYPVRALRRRVGFVAQAPVLFAGTVAENLRAGAAFGPPAAPGDAEVVALLERAGLDGSYAPRDAARLSGGERQRVAVARALAAGADALLLDEPTAALDPEVAERLLATVRALPASAGVTVVMVTHRLAEARSASTHLVMMEGGRVVESGATAALFAGAREARTRAYLGSAS